VHPSGEVKISGMIACEYTFGQLDITTKKHKRHKRDSLFFVPFVPLWLDEIS